MSDADDNGPNGQTDTQPGWQTLQRAHVMLWILHFIVHE